MKKTGRQLTLVHSLLKKLIGIFLNILNFLLAGNLPPLGSVCVVIEEQNRYLFIEHPEGYCSFPSGYMRWREDPVRAAQRECLEETGLNLRIGDMVGYRSTVGTEFGSISSLIIIFHAEIVSGELHGSVEGQPKWLDESGALGKLDPLTREILDTYLRYRATLAL
jgi:ADP-ribose pyrophosphatase YjhB (NUDIX family)